MEPLYLPALHIIPNVFIRFFGAIHRLAGYFGNEVSATILSAISPWPVFLPALGRKNKTD
jgi:hypothetical protein